MSEPETAAEDRAERAERKLALPVIGAAVISVPAVFMTTLDGTAAQVGNVLNWASLAVLTGESVLLFVLAGDRLQWLKEHRWTVTIAALTVPAVVFALGPVQLLRLVRFVGALRVIRVNRIVKAGRILRSRAELQGFWRNAVAVGITIVAAGFVALILADPTSDSRRFVDEVTARFGVVPVLVAGLVLGGATFVVLRYRTTGGSEPEDESGA